jgi:hypothetical protein
VGEPYAAAGLAKAPAFPPGGCQVFVERTERGAALDERVACPGPAVFGDASITIENLYRLRDEVKAMRDALDAKLAAKGRWRLEGRQPRLLSDAIYA